jgi:predicted DNA-binding antitoxin AbrB/MazE fold protein
MVYNLGKQIPEVAMETITTQAVYRNGVLKPEVHLNLPENSVVQVQVMKPAQSKVVPAKSLFGAFPELASLTKGDMTEIKRIWKKGLEKQARQLDKTARQ